MTYETSEFIFINRNTYGFTDMDILFVFREAFYTIYLFNKKIQYVKVQSPEEKMSNGFIPTEEESITQAEFEEIFNKNREPIQIWVDELQY